MPVVIWESGVVLILEISEIPYIILASEILRLWHPYPQHPLDPHLASSEHTAPACTDWTSYRPRRTCSAAWSPRRSGLRVMVL